MTNDSDNDWKARIKHFANHDLELEVVWQSPDGAIPQGGIPAVAKDGEFSFYSGEIIGDELFAVNGYGDEATARYDAERRDWRERCPGCRKRRPVYSGRGICDVCIEREDDELQRSYDMERMERESEQAMDEYAAGIPFGGSE